MQSIDQITPEITALFQPLDHHHLAVASTLAGLTPAAVYVDDPENPRAGVLWFHSRVYLALPHSEPALCDDLAALFEWELLPQMRSTGQEAFVLHAEPPEALEAAKDWLSSEQVYPGLRQHYTCEQLAANWRTLIPAGYDLRPVDSRLLADPGLENLEWLTEEMLSERPSVDDFLAHSFGVSLVHQNEIVGWCLSEYNCDRRCEVGVATAEAHQRRGLGTVMSLALVEEAFQRGYHRVGWHCWSRNVASGALARRSGFRLEHEFPVVLSVLDTG